MQIFLLQRLEIKSYEDEKVSLAPGLTLCG